MNLLENASPPKLLDVAASNFKLCISFGHMIYRVLGNILYDLNPKVK